MEISPLGASKEISFLTGSGLSVIRTSLDYNLMLKFTISVNCCRNFSEELAKLEEKYP